MTGADGMAGQLSAATKAFFFRVSSVFHPWLSMLMTGKSQRMMLHQMKWKLLHAECLIRLLRRAVFPLDVESKADDAVIIPGQLVQVKVKCAKDASAAI